LPFFFQKNAWADSPTHGNMLRGFAKLLSNELGYVAQDERIISMDNLSAHKSDPNLSLIRSEFNGIAHFLEPKTTWCSQLIDNNIGRLIRARGHDEPALRFEEDFDWAANPQGSVAASEKRMLCCKWLQAEFDRFNNDPESLAILRKAADQVGLTMDAVAGPNDSKIHPVNFPRDFGASLSPMHADFPKGEVSSVGNAVIGMLDDHSSFEQPEEVVANEKEVQPPKRRTVRSVAQASSDDDVLEDAQEDESSSSEPEGFAEAFVGTLRKRGCLENCSCTFPGEKRERNCLCLRGKKKCSSACECDPVVCGRE
jgi:hypothetical protein